MEEVNRILFRFLIDTATGEIQLNIYYRSLYMKPIARYHHGCLPRPTHKARHLVRFSTTVMEDLKRMQRRLFKGKFLA